MRTNEVLPEVVSGWKEAGLIVWVLLKAMLLFIVVIPLCLWEDLTRRRRQQPFVKCPFCPRTKRDLTRLDRWLFGEYVIGCSGCGKTYKLTSQIVVADKDGNPVSGG